MKVLLTGAFGNVGRSTITEVLAQNDELTIFEAPTKENLKLSRKYLTKCEVLFGDIRDYEKVKAAVKGKDAVIHLAAIIPPGADRNPELAKSVNVGGTSNVLRAIEETGNTAILAYASSIATYGSRIREPFIRVTDPLIPCADDEYAKQKVECERLIRESRVSWTILRLSYIVWKKKLAMDPLMFRMPLATSVEVCHTEDTGRAFAHAIHARDAIGKTFNIGGGARCRTTYRDYLDRMFRMFGLGGVRKLPESAFSSEGYHCGLMDTEEAEKILKFQRKSIEDYYKEVASQAWFLRIWATLGRPIARAVVLSRSPYLKKAHAKA